MHAFIQGESRPTTITFNESQLPALKAKYGDALRIMGGSGALQPAAVGITKPTMAQGELPKLKKQPAVKPASEKPIKTVTVAPKPAPVAVAKPKPPKILPNKPVVNITTGAYFISVDAAAKSIDTPSRHLSAHLTQTAKVKPKSVKGSVYRFANKQEIKAGKATVTQQELDALPKPRARQNMANRPSRYKVARPVVCLTNKQYYISSLCAAQTLGLSCGAMSEHLNINSHKKRRNVKGFVFRYATPQEIETQAYIPLRDQ